MIGYMKLIENIESTYIDFAMSGLIGTIIIMKYGLKDISEKARIMIGEKLLRNGDLVHLFGIMTTSRKAIFLGLIYYIEICQRNVLSKGESKN